MKAMKNLMLASLLIGLGACSNHEQDVLETSKCITVDAGFGTDSRVATNGLVSVFEENDAIGVYAWTGGSALPDSEAGFQVYNVENEFDGTNWNADEQMLWKDGATKHYFLGVYPPTNILTTKTYTIDPADQTRSDLLIAINLGQDGEGIAPQGNPVSLAFDHVMAKLRVNIQFNDEFAGTTPAVSSVTAEAKKTADIDWVTATATAKGDNAGVQLQSGTVAYSYESVMVPQNGFAGVAMVIDGETYTFTNTQDIQLKKGTITTLSLTVGRSAVEVGDITINDWTDGEAIAGYLKNIDEQITAIQTSLGKLKAVDTELNALIKALQDADGDHEAQIKALKAKDTELEGMIATLQAYVDNKITATRDWATTTFATLAQYQAVLNDIAEINLLINQNSTAITDITNTVTSIQTAITALKTSMETWVNPKLQQSLDDIATLQANLTNLSNSVATTDQELADAIAAQQTALDNAMSGLSKTISDAITAAIENDGMIDLAISEKINAANSGLQSQISTITSAITDIQGRLNNLEARIQSIRFLPEYSDGKVELTSANMSVTLKFMVSPAAAAKAVEQAYTDNNTDNNTVVTAFISRTKSRADATVDPTAIHVTAVEGTEAGILTVAVNTENLPADYWADAEDANLFIRISDGNNDVISEMIPTYKLPYLTFTVDGKQSLVLNVGGTLNPTIQYSADGGVWTNFVMNENNMSTTTPVSFTNSLRMRGKSASGTMDVSTSEAFSISFEEDTEVTCSGDIRTLVDYTNYETTSTENACFIGLFMNCSALDDASGLKLISNNDEMAASCYAFMFANCSKLESAPALLATTLAESCYLEMFAGCSNLTTAPALPATTLAEGCYSNMFADCSTLTTAPALPATTLAKGCYIDMFNGCTSLNSVTMLATDISAENCLTNWLSGVATTGTFTKHKDMESLQTGTSGIPEGWTIIKQ